MMKRLILLVAAVSGLAWIAPEVSAAPSPCRQATRTETGASDIVGGLATYEDNFLEPLEIGTEPPEVTVKVTLAAPSCTDISYHVKVYDDPGLTTVLAENTVTGDGTSIGLTLLSEAPVGDPSTSTVYVVVWTSSSRNAAIDRAPNTGANASTDGIGGGQSWH